MPDFDDIERLRALGVRSYRWPDGAVVEFGEATPARTATNEEEPKTNGMPTRAELFALAGSLAPKPVEGSPLDKETTR